MSDSPLGIIICFFNVYRRFTSSNYSGKDLPGLLVAPCFTRSRRTFLRFRISAHQLTAMLNRIIGLCLDHMAGLSSVSIRFCHFLTCLSIPDCPDQTVIKQELFRFLSWTQAHALCNPLIYLREGDPFGYQGRKQAHLRVPTKTKIPREDPQRENKRHEKTPGERKKDTRRHPEREKKTREDPCIMAQTLQTVRRHESTT